MVVGGGCDVEASESELVGRDEYGRDMRESRWGYIGVV